MNSINIIFGVPGGIAAAVVLAIGGFFGIIFGGIFFLFAFFLFLVFGAVVVIGVFVLVIALEMDKE